MIDLMSIKRFLQTNNPTWNMMKIGFIAFLLWQVVKKQKQQSMDNIPNNYKIISKKGSKTLWYDKSSNSYAVDDGINITPFNDINEAKKHL